MCHKMEKLEFILRAKLYPFLDSLNNEKVDKLEKELELFEYSNMKERIIGERFLEQILQNKKKTIGLRIPDNKIALAIIETLGHPILSASFPGENIEDYTDPEIIQEHWGKQIDIVIDGGIGGIIPSTVVDCTTDEYIILRQGLGIWEF